jgi:hypothetical protein
VHTWYRAAAPLIFHPGRFGDPALTRPQTIDSAGTAYRGDIPDTTSPAHNRIICARSQQRLNRRSSAPSRRLARPSTRTASAELVAATDSDIQASG